MIATIDFDAELNGLNGPALTYDIIKGFDVFGAGKFKYFRVNGSAHLSAGKRLHFHLFGPLLQMLIDNNLSKAVSAPYSSFGFESGRLFANEADKGLHLGFFSQFAHGIKF